MSEVELLRQILANFHVGWICPICDPEYKERRSICAVVRRDGNNKIGFSCQAKGGGDRRYHMAEAQP